MKIGILGTGIVGTTIGTKLAELGFEVKMGSRASNNKAASEWSKSNGPKASNGSFEEAAKFGEVIFLCVKGEIALDVIKLAKGENLKNKTLIDISNPLDFSHGMPPSLFISNTNSLGEEIQKKIPNTNVVKTLNIVSSILMVDPKKCGGDPTMFVCGNKDDAKKEAIGILKKFGWTDIIDLGEIKAARSTEMLLPIWLNLFSKFQDPHFAFKVVRKK